MCAHARRHRAIGEGLNCHFGGGNNLDRGTALVVAGAAAVDHRRVVSRFSAGGYFGFLLPPSSRARRCSSASTVSRAAWRASSLISRAPVKCSISVNPDLSRALRDSVKVVVRVPGRRAPHGSAEAPWIPIKCDQVLCVDRQELQRTG